MNDTKSENLHFPIKNLAKKNKMERIGILEHVK